MLTRGRTLPRRGLPLPGFDNGGVVARSMPLGLMLGGPFSPFSRAISSRCAATVCLRAATSDSNCTANSLSWARFSTSGSSGGGTLGLNRKATPKRTRKRQPPYSLRRHVTFQTHRRRQTDHAPSLLPVLPELCLVLSVPSIMLSVPEGRVSLLLPLKRYTVAGRDARSALTSL